MLPLRVRTKQHDSEIDSSADVNPQPPQVQFPLPNGASPAGPAGEADGPSLYPSTPQYQSSTRSPYYSIAYGTYSDRVEYPSRAACATRIQCYPPQCSNTKHKGPCWHALIRLRIWLFSFRSYACSRPHPDGWVIRHTSLPLIRILQPLQELESEAQLLNAPPLPIRLQSSTFGTGFFFFFFFFVNLIYCAKTGVHVTHTKRCLVLGTRRWDSRYCSKSCWGSGGWSLSVFVCEGKGVSDNYSR